MNFTFEQDIHSTTLLTAIRSLVPQMPAESRLLFVSSEEVVWKSIGHDSFYLDLVIQHLCESGEVTDDEFGESFLFIEDVLSLTHLFNTLDSPQIKVSAAHTGTTPARHSFNALRKLNTVNLTPEQRIIARVAAVIHDMGKVLIAAKDYAMLHPQVGALLWHMYCRSSAYLDTAQLPAQFVEQIGLMITFHHLTEVMFYLTETFTHEAVLAFFDRELLEILEQLTYADLLSSNGNEKHLPASQEQFRVLLSDQAVTV